MDGYQNAARDFVTVRYALFAVAFGVAFLMETITRHVGYPNALLELGEAPAMALITEVEPQVEADKVRYLYRADGETPMTGAFRFETWRTRVGDARYRPDQQIEVAVSTYLPDVSYPQYERHYARVDMAIWLGSISGLFLMVALIVWNVVEHIRFTKYLRRN